MRKQNLVILGDYSYYLYELSEMKDAGRDCASQIIIFLVFEYQISFVYCGMYTIDKQMQSVVSSVSAVLSKNRKKKNNDVGLLKFILHSRTVSLHHPRCKINSHRRAVENF